MRRKERWRLPPPAVREAIINAVAHADYAQRGAPLRVSIFDDRLEVENPGLLPFGLTLEDLPRGVSKLRNRVIGGIFHALGLVEQWGSGIQRMTAACREARLAAPVFEELATRFRVTIASAQVSRPVLDDTDQSILASLAGCKGLSTSEIAAAIGLTPRATRTRLARMVGRGLVREIGTGPGPQAALLPSRSRTGINTMFVDIAESLPVFSIDKDYVTRLDELPTPADKAAALEAVLTGELSEDDPSFVYRELGERLQQIKERRDATDEAAAQRLRELQEIAAGLAATKQEPERFNLTQPGEYGLFTILRAHARGAAEEYVADCARSMVTHLRTNGLLSSGWSNSIGGRMRVEQSLLAESWNLRYEQLGFDRDAEDPPFLKLAVSELAKADGS